MRATARNILHLAFCIALAAVTVSVHAAETIDRVLAVAAGELIMLSDVTAARDLGLVPAPAATGDPIASVLARLVDRALILAEVDRYAPPEPGADAVDREVQTVRSRFATPAATRRSAALRSIRSEAPIRSANRAFRTAATAS